MSGSVVRAGHTRGHGGLRWVPAPLLLRGPCMLRRHGAPSTPGSAAAAAARPAAAAAARRAATAVKPAAARPAAAAARPAAARPAAARPAAARPAAAAPRPAKSAARPAANAVAAGFAASIAAAARPAALGRGGVRGAWRPFAAAKRCQPAQPGRPIRLRTGGLWQHAPQTPGTPRRRAGRAGAWLRLRSCSRQRRGCVGPRRGRLPRCWGGRPCRGFAQGRRSAREAKVRHKVVHVALVARAVDLGEALARTQPHEAGGKAAGSRDASPSTPPFHTRLKHRLKHVK